MIYNTNKKSFADKRRLFASNIQYIVWILSALLLIVRIQTYANENELKVYNAVILVIWIITVLYNEHNIYNTNNNNNNKYQQMLTNRRGELKW